MAPPKHTPKEPSKPPARPSPSPSPSPSPPLSPHGDNDEDEEYTASSDAPSPPPNTLPKTTTNSNSDEEDGDDDGDDVDDGGEGDSTDDGDTPSKFTIKPSVPTPAAAADDDDDTEPGSPPPPPSKSKPVKPINTKPMGSKSKADSKKVAASTPAKRPAEASGAAMSDDEGQHPAKKQIIQRLWSDEDEITILKGMVEYKRKGRDPLADFQGFFRYIRKSLQLECTHTQLSSKMRVLRSKFYSWVKRANEGKQPTSNKPKDKLVFELSQKIWGSKLDEKEKNNVEEEAGNKEQEAKVKGGSEVSNGKSKRKEANKSGQRTSAVSVALPAVETTAAPAAAAPVLGGGEEQSWLMDDLCIRGGGVSEELVKKGVSLMDGRVVAEYEEKWKAMKMMEMEVHMKRAELVKGHIGVILEALKAGKR